MSHSPRLAEEMARRRLEVPCPDCDGGMVGDDVCAECEGYGAIPTPEGRAILAFVFDRHVRDFVAWHRTRR